MKILYKSKGAAAEYAKDAWSLNIYNGCSNGCKYCFNQRWDKKEGDYFKYPTVRRDLFRKLNSDFEKIGGEKVFMSFKSDIFQELEKTTMVVPSILSMCISYDIIPIILTKNEIPNDYWDNLVKAKAEIWVTLTTYEPSLGLEPYASLPHHRILNLAQAKSHGLKTGVSLEPIISYTDAVKIILATKDFTDKFYIGKMNYYPELSEIQDWKAFTFRIIEFCREQKVTYHIKKSLIYELNT